MASTGRYTNEYYVLKDGPIQKVERPEGQGGRDQCRGLGSRCRLRAMLRKGGLEDKRDYTVLEAPFPTMRAMLAEKKVDLIPAVLPFSLDPELKKIARPLFSQRDAIGVTDMIVWTARKPFIDKNRAAMVDFMEDSIRIVRWYLDPANQKEAAEIAARVTKQPVERFGWLFTEQRLLPQSRHGAGSEGAAEQREHHEGTRLRERQHQCRKLFRSQRRAGRAEAAEIEISKRRGGPKEANRTAQAARFQLVLTAQLDSICCMSVIMTWPPKASCERLVAGLLSWT